MLHLQRASLSAHSASDLALSLRPAPYQSVRPASAWAWSSPRRPTDHPDPGDEAARPLPTAARTIGSVARRPSRGWTPANRTRVVNGVGI